VTGNGFLAKDENSGERRIDQIRQQNVGAPVVAPRRQPEHADIFTVELRRAFIPNLECLSSAETPFMGCQRNVTLLHPDRQVSWRRFFFLNVADFKGVHARWHFG
jgi:hypothetical protein